MPGHVFVTRGDLTRLWCDAWLMPCDSRFEPRRHWYAELLGDRTGPPIGTESEGSPRARRIPQWADGRPTPWLVDVGGGRAAPPEWFVEGVREWLDACAPGVRAARVTARARPLLALPLVGTGMGGAAGRAGDVVRLLLPVLYDGAERYGVDIALVAHDGPAHAAALQTRRRMQDPRVWPAALGAAQRAAAAELAGHARRGNLVLFLGAGLSMGAGIPGWDDLLVALAAEVGIGAGAPDELAAFGRLSPPDRARLIAARLERRGGESAGHAVARFVGRYDNYAVAHLLLAGLPVRSAVTTNYDTLYERAARDAGDPVSVLPYEPSTATRSWLLKMHGCVRAPRDIVLTRADFLRYDQRRAALRGVVQAMLLTRHMLFVGFSMTDDNFHRILDDVRRAAYGDAPAAGAAPGVLATTLSIEPALFFDELWSDIERIDLSTTSTADSARLLDIFLDYVATEAGAPSTHLLDDRYGALLDAAEREVRDGLRSFVDGLSPAARETEVWKFVEVWLRRIGRDDDEEEA